MIRDIYPPRVEFDFTKGSLQDQSANGYASTLTAGSAYWGKGEKGRNFVFDGAATAINLGNVSDFDNDEVQSFAAVFKTTSAAIQMIAIKSDGATVFPGWAFYLSGGQIFFRIYQTSTATGFRLSTDDTFNDGEEHSVVVTYGGLNGLSKGGAGTKIYVDNQLVDTTLSHDIAFTASTLNTNDYRIGMASYGSLWFDGPMSYVAQFGVELSAQEATQLLTELNTAIPYNLTDVRGYPASTGMKDGVVQAYIADGKGWNESVAAVSIGVLENTGWQRASGTWQVDDVDGFNKKINCIADGVISIPMNQVYGTWEFKLTKGNDASTTIVAFMNDKPDSRQNGYYLIFGSNEQVNLSRRTAGSGTTLMETASSTIVVGTEYDVKITRATNGSFTVYLDGVAVTPTSGTNPVTDANHTTCSWATLDVDATDIIRDFRFINYIE